MHELLVCGAGIIAGAINAVAGGGTLISFPTLIWLGVPSITANATNTVALWPGSLGGVWGYRREMRGCAVIPKCDAAGFPGKADGVFRPQDVLPQELEKDFALPRRHADD